jgi:mannose-6-phosphate isomerase-like protein (cupin superfamily)
MQAKYAFVDLGPVSAWSGFSFVHPPSGLSLVKRFLKQEMGLTGMEISANSMRPGEALPFRHRHEQNEEVYIFLDGEGEFEADGQMIPIRPGTVIRCAPGSSRAWRNTGEGPMPYLCIQAKHESYGEGHTITDGRAAEGSPAWAVGR